MERSRRANSKRGFTLAELVITMGVMALVLAMVVTFAMLINNNVQTRKAETEQIEELNEVSQFIKDWFYTFDRNGYGVGITVNDETVDYDLATDTYTTKKSSRVLITESDTPGIAAPNKKLTFSGGKLTASYTDTTDGNLVYQSENIKSVEFVWNEDLNMLKCIFTYGGVVNEDTGIVENEQTYVLLLYRHTYR